MWLSILSLLFGALPAIAGQIAAAKTAKANATTDQQRIAADERIKSLEAQASVLQREATTPWNSLARFFLIAPFGLYLWWIVLNDKIVCKWYTPIENVGELCRTDPLSPWLTGICGAMIGFYFVTNAITMAKR